MALLITWFPSSFTVLLSSPSLRQLKRQLKMLMSWVSLKGGVIEVDQYDDYRKSLDPWWFVWIYQWWNPWSIYRYFAWAHFFAMITLIISHHIPPQHVIPVMMMVSNRSSRLGNTQDILTKHGIEFSLLSKLVCAKHFPILLQMRRVCTALFVRHGFPSQSFVPHQLMGICWWIVGTCSRSEKMWTRVAPVGTS